MTPAPSGAFFVADVAAATIAWRLILLRAAKTSYSAIMSDHTEQPHPIVPRERLDFGLDGDIPKYWWGGDPFKSRFFDALSVIFPPGERFFMTCVRDFRDQVTEPQLLSDIQAFNRQEAQHSMVHGQFNARLKAQGIDVDYLNSKMEQVLFKIYRGWYGRGYTLAVTSALEHFTAISAHSLFDERDIMGDADHRVRAMFSWHAIEEVEHKGVAYDVMQQYAKVGYFTRVLALLDATLMFPGVIFFCLNHMLKQDGFNGFQRAGLMAKGLWWLFKPSGFAAPLYRHYFPYYKPAYHPWQESEQLGYSHWIQAFNRHHNPVEASEHMRAALAR